MRIITIGHSTSSNIYIASEYVSSNHAELLLMDNGDIFLTDKGSRNGRSSSANVSIPTRRYRCVAATASTSTTCPSTGHKCHPFPRWTQPR